MRTGRRANWRTNGRGPQQANIWEAVDISKGQYLTPGAIAEKYDIHFNRQVAVSAAIRYCRKCANMKGSWVGYSDWAGGHGLLHHRENSQGRVQEGLGYVHGGAVGDAVWGYVGLSTANLGATNCNTSLGHCFFASTSFALIRAHSCEHGGRASHIVNNDI